MIDDRHRLPARGLQCHRDKETANLDLKSVFFDEEPKIPRDKRNCRGRGELSGIEAKVGPTTRKHQHKRRKEKAICMKSVDSSSHMCPSCRFELHIILPICRSECEGREKRSD